MPRRHEGVSATAIGTAVFLSGAVLLGVEIAASRVLAPAFGSSLYVWGSLIGVVLAGLALGYWLGGVLADRFPSPLLLVGALTIGAGLVLAVPALDGWVIERIVSWDPGPRLNPLLTAVILFGPASVVLASASPIAVRLAARSLERLGRTAGRLFSVSTAGSIVGTFATAFWLVPELGTDQVLAVGALTLLVAATILALAERLLVPAAALAMACVAAGFAVAGLAPQESGRLEVTQTQNWSPLYRQREQRSPGALDPDAIAEQEPGFEVREARDTRYHRMLVLDGEDTRYLRFDNTFQSAMRLDDPYATVFAYTDYLQLGLAYAPTARNVLFIGLGGASAVKRVWRDFPRLDLHAVELDPEVVRVAHRWFRLPESPRLEVTVQDGRRFLQTHPGRFDVIMIDAYFADSIPFHLATAQFFELVRERLSPGGVVVSNVIGAVAGPQSKLLRSMAKTYRTAFPSVAVHPVFEGSDRAAEGIRNVIVVATEGALPSTDVLLGNWSRLRAASPRAIDLSQAIRNRWRRPLRLDDVPLLTDGFAPTDALLVG
ncbi:MAG TPA: fused MFS/spermidine synthase [Gaiellaceae bacterium]|nr:fused MFS/spermidine synthase [Gaiellaceae bacterium]